MYISHLFAIINFYSKVGIYKEKICIWREREGENIERMRKRGKDRENEIERKSLRLSKGKSIKIITSY